MRLKLNKSYFEFNMFFYKKTKFVDSRWKVASVDSNLC